MAKKQRSAQAFKQALDAQILATARAEGRDANTIRLRAMVQRFLARLFHRQDAIWLLKGGFAMELRFHRRARATRDVDLMIGTGILKSASLEEELQARLQEVLSQDLGDHLQFRISLKEIALTSPPEGGARLVCQVMLLGKECGKFSVDVGCGDAVDDPPDDLELASVVPLDEFASARVRVISAYQQFAEKIHAYTLPWGDRENTRTKDLVDLVLLVEEVQQDLRRLRFALRRTFTTRAKQALPEALPEPPPRWEAEFRQIAHQTQLAVEDYREAFRILEDFWRDQRLGQGDEEPFA